MARIRLKFVQSVLGRDGKVRHYFRRRGHDRVPLPGLPGSAEFMRAYEQAASGVSPVADHRSKPGSIEAAVIGYLGSASFSALALSTRRTRRQVLDHFRRAHGDKGVATLQKHHVERMIAAKSTPATALLLLKTIRELMKYAVKVGLRRDDPTAGIQKPKFGKNIGLPTWSEEDIARFEARHPVASKARLAMALGLYTGQRGGDVVRMGPQHIKEGVLHLRQQKTGTPLLIPVHPELKALLDAVPPGQLVFLTGRGARPVNPDAFSAWFKERCREAGLPPRASFHGLRKAAARRLAEAGMSANVIAAVTGHKSLAEVARYTAAADQLRLARQGIEALGGKHWENDKGNMSTCFTFRANNPILSMADDRQEIPLRKSSSF
jgi:integrase